MSNVYDVQSLFDWQSAQQAAGVVAAVVSRLCPLAKTRPDTCSHVALPAVVECPETATIAGRASSMNAVLIASAPLEMR